MLKFTYSMESLSTFIHQVSTGEILFTCKLYISFNNFFEVYLFTLERQRQSEWGRGRERGRKRIPSRSCTVSTEPNVGLSLMKL